MDAKERVRWDALSVHLWLAALIFACTLLAACTIPAPATPSPPPTPTSPLRADLALTGATLIDGTGSDPLPDAVILILGEHILAVGSRSTVAVPPGTKTLDLSGATVLPGFFNAHVHGANDTEQLERWLQAGVTTVRDLSPRVIGIDNLRAFYRLAEESEHNPKWARVVAATPILSPPGGYGHLTVSGPEDARRQVDEMIDAGADLVKFAIEDNLPLGQRYPLMPLADMRAIVEQAHQRGVPVSAHVSTAAHVELALAAGVDDLAHMAYDEVPLDLITRTVEANVYWVPTMELWVGVEFGAPTMANLRRFIEAGGQVALGTDFSGYWIPFDDGMPIKEIGYLAEAGMTPMALIVAATRNAAHVCGRDRDLGTLEPGKLADILVVDGDPLIDLNALQQVRMVLKGGVVVTETVAVP